MKFQVGSIIECINPDFCKGKQKAKVLEINTENYNDLCIQWEDGDIQWADSTLFQLVSNPTPKSLLKDGVIVTDKNGNRFIVFNNKLIPEDMEYCSFLNLDEVNDDLTFNNDDIYPISKLEFDGKVIWERPKDIIVNFIDSNGNAKPSDIANILEKIKTFAKENNITKATIEIREEDDYYKNYGLSSKDISF